MIDFERVIKIAEGAGDIILDIYENLHDFEIEKKSDSSPLTIADKKSHEFIKSKLKEITPDIPILSEEGKDIPYEIRKDWKLFWLIDPLDGTKEFIKRNGEFTVNIALIKDRSPMFGVINVPVQKTTYYAIKNEGAYKKTENSVEKISVSNFDPHNIRVVASRSHMNEDTKIFIENLERKYGNVTVVSAGSSLKFCLVAEGKADIYPRFGPTMGWDTAAGHAIVEAAGGKVIRVNGVPLTYNKTELLNPYFIATSGKVDHA